MDKRDDVIGGLVLFLFGMVVTFLSLQLPLGTFRVAGTGLFPLSLGILLMILSGIFILNVFLSQASKEKGTAPSSEIAWAARRVLPFLGTVALATALLNPLGYPLTAFLMLLVLQELLGMKRRLLSLLLAAIAAGASYLLFVWWLKVPLPKGWPGI